MTNHTATTTARTHLDTALADLTRAGIKTPCQTNPAPWLSEVRKERAQAAEACQWCPILTECATYATTAEERWLVWGGADYHGKTYPRKRGAAA